MDTSHATLPNKELYIPVNNGNLFCRTIGEQTTPLLILHGGPGLGHHYLLPQMAELGKFSFAIFYDQRGTGFSNGNNDWQTNPFETYINDIDELRKAFGFEKISLLSHSYGGILASLYALAFPKNVEKIIYVNSVPVSSEDYLTFVKHRSQLVDHNKTELDAIRQSQPFIEGDPKTVEQYYRIYFKQYFSSPELANTLNLTMTREAAINNFKIYNLFYNYLSKNPFDLYQQLKSLNKPSLIIAGDQDVIPLHYPEQLHNNIPSSEFKLLQHCGHFSYIDQPKILFENIKQFISIKS